MTAVLIQNDQKSWTCISELFLCFFGYQKIIIKQKKKRCVTGGARLKSLRGSQRRDSRPWKRRFKRRLDDDIQTPMDKKNQTNISNPIVWWKTISSSCVSCHHVFMILVIYYAFCMLTLFWDFHVCWTWTCGLLPGPDRAGESAGRCLARQTTGGGKPNERMSLFVPFLDNPMVCLPIDSIDYQIFSTICHILYSWPIYDPVMVNIPVWWLGIELRLLIGVFVNITLWSIPWLGWFIILTAIFLIKFKTTNQFLFLESISKKW